MIKLAFCTDGIYPEAVGGMQRHSRLLIEELAGKDIELTVLHPHDKKIFSELNGVQEIQVAPIDEGKNYLRECYRYSQRVRDVLTAGDYNVVYSQGMSVWSGMKRLNMPVIVNPHGLEPFQAIGKKDRLIAIPFKKVFKKIFSPADRVVSLGGRLTTILEGQTDPNKLVILPNATTLPGNMETKSWPDSKEPVRFFFVARFAGNKGIHILMDAVKQLNEEGYEDKMIFELGGKGPLFEHYSQGFQFSNVNYHGFVSDEDLARLYHEANCFILPTLFEGMPTVVLEAMAHKLPIIVTDVGATAEQVDATNGFLIQKNSVDEFKKALISFFELSREQKTAMSDASYRRVSEKFTWPVVAAQHYDLFQSLVK